jgi:hypothetical protein
MEKSLLIVDEKDDHVKLRELAELLEIEPFDA